jgi:hypothetical protein
MTTKLDLRGRIRAVVPAHTYEGDGTWTWSTPRGLWQIELGLASVMPPRTSLTVKGVDTELLLPADEASLELVLMLLRQRGAIAGAVIEGGAS